MEVETFGDARRFRERADGLLLRDEGANNLLLGTTTSVIATTPDQFESFTGWVVSDAGEPIAAAAQAGSSNLMLSVTTSDSALALLADQIGALPGVHGPRPQVDTFVSARAASPELEMVQGVFQLERVQHPPHVDGRSRPAQQDDLDQLMGMWLEFVNEALSHVRDASRTREAARSRVEEQSDDFGVWVHETGGRLVSLSGHTGPTPNGIRIAPVYTLPESRGRGYASSLVAAQSQWLLDGGRRFCFLYTDLANPKSNSVYKRIGYRQIGEAARYAFSPKT